MSVPAPALAISEQLPSTESLVAREVQTIGPSDLGVSRPRRIAFDSVNRFFLVSGHADGEARIVRVEPSWDPTDVTEIEKSSLLRGVSGASARHPTTGIEYRFTSDAARIEGYDGAVLIAAYDSTALPLVDPSSMTFAPSSDRTDDADAFNLFVADAGDAANAGGVIEVTLEQSPTTAALQALTEDSSTMATVESATLIQSIDTSAWNPPSTDPSGIVWDESVDQMIVVDSEVNETQFFQGVNLWRMSRSGAIQGVGTTTGYSDEPTGVGLQASPQTMFISDDTGTNSLYVVKVGTDGVMGTSDDTADQIDLEAIAGDPEDPIYHVIEGVVYFVSGTDREIFRVAPNDGIFGNGNDTITSFDISSLGPTDFEGLTHAPNRGTLYVGARSTDQIFEITTSGTLLRTIDVNIPGMTVISGLAMAPSSTNPTTPSLWFVDRAADAQNDGMLYEIGVPDLDDPPSGNAAPFATDDTTSTSQDTPVVIDVLATDFDANGDPLSVDNVTTPSNGTAVINPDDTVTYTPSAAFGGTDTFTYQAFDGTTTSNVATVTVTVTGPNQPPLAVDDTASTNQDTAVTIDVLENDTDPYGDPLEVASVSTADNGSTSINPDDTITYTPDPGFFGTDTFSYDVCDNGGLCDSGTVTVTVREGQPMYYVSVDSSTTLPGITGTVRDEDIVVYDATSGTWEMFFDASDMGITSSDLDAFHIGDDGSVLISYSSDGLIIPGLVGGPTGEAIDDSDLIAFTPTSTGDNTSGNFTFYFDGSEVGLTDSSEDIVGVFEFDDGSLGISTKGGFEVPGLEAGDQVDVHQFSGTFGTATSGTWSLFFDGSDVGFTTSDNIDGISLAGDLFLTTEPAYSAAGGSGEDEDISRFAGTFGDSTSGTAALEFDASAAGLDPTLVVDGVHVGNVDEPEPVNDAPVLDPIGAQSGDEQTLITFTATASDADLPAQSLTFSLGGSVPAGASIDPVSGVFTWTPSEAQGPGDFTFDVVVTDNGSPTLSDSETITVTVTEANTAPVANAGPDQAVVTDQLVTLDGSASSDVDIPIQTLTYSWTIDAQPAGSTAALTGAATVAPTFTPDVAGDYVISLVVSDGLTSSVADIVTVTVTEVNDAPVLDPIGAQSGDEQTLITFTATASDADLPAQSLTFSLGGSVPAGASIDPVSGVFTWTPSEAQGPGDFTFDVVVTDNGSPTLSDSETITVTVTEANTAPVANAGPDQAVVTDQLVTLDGSASSDVDIPIQTLTYSWTIDAQPAGSTAALTGAATVAPTFTPDVAGDYVISLVVSDGLTSSVADIVTVTVTEVNDAPVLDPIGAQSGDEQTLITFTATASDADLPAQSLTFSLGGSVPAGASIDPVSGVFTWTPSEAQGPGDFTFDVVVTDNGSPTLSDSETITVTVTEANTAPVANAGPDQAVVTDQLVTLDGSASSDVDIPIQTLTYSWTIDAQPAGSTAALTGAATVAPTFTPDVAGDYVISLVVSDGLTSSVADIVTVTVTEVNDAPVLDPIGAQSGDEQTLITFTATASDADLPAQSLTFSLGGSVPAGASIDPVSGVFTWTPSEAQGPGDFTFDVVVTDNGSPTLSDSETITVTVTEANTAPVANAGPDQAVVTDQLVTLDGSASSDVDIPIQTLTYSWTIDAQPAGSTAALTGAATVAPTFTPDVAGDYVISLVVSDGLTSSVADIVTVTVTEVNTAPVLDPIGAQSGDEQTLITFTATASDADLPAQSLTFSLGGSVPAGASIDPVSGVFTWTPSEAQGPGDFTFDVVVTDNGSPTLSDSETITVTVTEANTAPVAVDDGFSTGTDIHLVVAAPGVLGNDTDGDDHSLSVSSADTVSSQGGAVVVTTDGSFSYTPPAGFSGTDTFIYIANDGFADSNIATVTISVGNVTVIQTATEESTTFGTVATGDYTDTHDLDSAVEVLEEERTPGGPRNRTSRLKHEWVFAVERGTLIELAVTAFRTVNSEGDDFAFDYSTDGGVSWSDAFTITSDSLSTYTADLPTDTNGEVIVRVIDVDRTGGNDVLDRLTVDAIVVTTINPLPPLPEVTITASDPVGAETGDPGQFTVSRDVTDGPLTVNLAVDGTATNGIDYTAIGDTVILPTGVAAVTIDVAPIDDAVGEGDELVEITVLGDGGYTIGVEDTAIVTIGDDDFAGGEFRVTLETTTFGEVTSGDYTDTFFADGDGEILIEELYAGRKKTRLQHTWTIDGISGTSGVLSIGATTSGEVFAFSYSLDGGITWVPATNGAAFTLNDATAVLVQVTDTDSSKGDTTRDALTVDHILLTTE